MRGKTPRRQEFVFCRLLEERENKARQARAAGRLNREHRFTGDQRVRFVHDFSCTSRPCCTVQTVCNHTPSAVSSSEISDFSAARGRAEPRSLVDVTTNAAAASYVRRASCAQRVYLECDMVNVECKLVM